MRKAVKPIGNYPPSSITTDKLASYPKAIRRLRSEGLLPKNVEHRTSKYLNMVIRNLGRGFSQRTQGVPPRQRLAAAWSVRAATL